ncbi:spore germination protein [Paenibacillus sp. SI8]|uniref:spore germination protein n=1 Tax=unclassified Paenibacillus TaxID=185978 RepID=UPI003467B5D7
MNEDELRQLFADSADVIIKSYQLGEGSYHQKFVAMYCEGMTSIDHLEQSVFPQMQSLMSKQIDRNPSELDLNMMLQFHEINGSDVMKELTVSLYRGELIFFFEETNKFYALDISSPPNRTPEESSTETSIKGPRDGFTESMITNVALVRKRLLTSSLCCWKIAIGQRSHTMVALLYIGDVIDMNIIEDAKQRLFDIDIDALVASSQLEAVLAGREHSFFPLVEITGRPDYVVQSLLRGRFAVVVDGSPMVLIAPANLTFLLKSPEDIHYPFYYVAFERILRLGGLVVSSLLPGFWIAVSAYNIEQIPFPLVATISSSRLGLPISGPMDFILMLVLFELFREAGMRLPKSVGQTVTVVGGLIVGDAAIRAGITSPTTLVITSISTISMFTLVNQSLLGTVTLLRIFVLFASSIFGIFGFMLSLMGIVLYLSTLESFGIPYLAPLSPPGFREMITAVFAKPWDKIRRRPQMLNPNDATRQGDESS